jgi:peptide/nickel transport system permease protein
VSAVDPLSGMPSPGLPDRSVSTRSRFHGRLRPLLTVHWLLFTAFIAIAIFAPLLAPYDPVRADLTQRLLPPSGAHWFGTDDNGFDVFSRVLYATRTNFSVAILGVALAALLGVPLGAASGYLRGFVGGTISRIAEMVQAVPLFLFALMVFAALGNSKKVLVGVIAFATAPVFLKLTRSVVLPLKNSDFVSASRCAGLGTTAIIARHILPNSLAPVVSQLAVSCAYAIQIVAGLSFLGLGVHIPEPEWGSMIQQGANNVLYGQWWTSVFPGIAVLLAVMAFGGIGRQLTARYEQ